MREILFRGKSLHDGEWLYGAYYKQEEYYGDPCDYHYIISSKDELEDNMMLFESVIPETVGQYTGLTDKNGKRVFEGDIVSTDIARPYLIVEFRDGCFMFNCNDGGEDYYDIMLPICKEPHNKYEYGEVIGNIHDNPEFLKGGEGDGLY